jgi:uncharacterized membrane protein (UPF0127 family)
MVKTVEIINETKGFTISPKAQMRGTFFGRFRGLMLSKRMDIILGGKKDSVLDSTIHMMFMLYPIDVIWVSAAMNVVDVKKGIPAFNPIIPRSWSMSGPKAPAKYVVEIASGDIKNTDAGDKIAFK